MNDLDWLIGVQFKLLVRREHDWNFQFEDQISLVVECLWRLIEAGRIRLTSEDDGQRFGHPSAVDAATEVNARLAGTLVDTIQLREGTLDLSITFSTGHMLELVSDSSGYEAWNISGNNQFSVATGGGEFATFRDPPTKG